MEYTQTQLRNKKAFKTGYDTLNVSQKAVIQECVHKKSGGLSLVMGYGKTRISIVLGLYFKYKKGLGNPILVIAEKTLISSWNSELKNVFGNTLSLLIFHNEYINTDTATFGNADVILTTPEVMRKYYKKFNLENNLITKVESEHGFGNRGQLHPVKNVYNIPRDPFLNDVNLGGGLLFSTKFAMYIIDEVQNYTKIETLQTQAMLCVSSNYRWLLSGTIINEPTISRMLGYYTLLQWPDAPRDLPEMSLWVSRRNYPGFETTLVIRNNNDSFKEPIIREHLLSHTLSEPEAKVYISMKDVLKQIQTTIQRMHFAGNQDGIRLFNAYRMAMITYLRQSLVVPLLPISNVALEYSDHTERSGLCKIVNDTILGLGIEEYLNDPSSLRSSRIDKVIETLNTCSNKRVVVFGCFRTSVDVLMYFLKKETTRPIFSIEPGMSSTRRGVEIDSFGKSDSGILLLTYELGAEGINLQCADTVFITDYWWNNSKTKQAVSRVNRMGQLSPEINVYYFTSNTGIEKALLDKQEDKLRIISELGIGPMKSKVKRIDMNQVIRLILSNDNITVLSNVLKK